MATSTQHPTSDPLLQYLGNKSAASSTVSENPFGQPLGTPAAPAAQEQKAPTDPLLSYLNHSKAPQSQEPKSSDPLLQYLGARPKPQQDLDDPSKDYAMFSAEPWYAKTWAFLNTPLYNLRKNRTLERTGAGPIELGIEQGAEDLLSNLETPLSLGLLVAGPLGLMDAGEGVIADTIKPGLKLLGVSDADVPIVTKGMKILVDSGFTVPQVAGLVTQVPRLLDSLKFGDYQSAAREATEALGTGGLTVLGTRGLVADAGSMAQRLGWVKPSDEIGDAVRIFRDFGGDRQRAIKAGMDVENRINAALKVAGAENDDITRGAIKFNMEAGGDKDLLRKQEGVLTGSIPPDELGNVVEQSERILETAEKRPAGEPEPRIPIHPQESAFTAMLRQNKEQMAARSRDELIEDAVKHFGTTEDVRKTGIVLNDGRRLDFSDEENPGRVLSHKAIGNVGGLKEADRPALAGFLSDTGSMRTRLAEGQVNVEFSDRHMPSEGQIDWIREALAENPHATLAVDITNEKGKLVGTAQTDDAEARDIGRTIGAARKKIAAPIILWKPVTPETESGVHWPIYKDGKQIGEAVIKKEGKTATINWLGVPDSEEATPAISNQIGISGLRELARRYLAENPEIEEIKGARLGGAIRRKVLEENAPKNVTIAAEKLAAHTEPSATEAIPVAERKPLSLERYNTAYSPGEKAKLLAIMRKAQNLTPAEQNVADLLRDHFERELAFGWDNDILHSAIQDYFPHHWLPEAEGDQAINRLKQLAAGGRFDTDFPFAKKRVFSNNFEGILAGRKLATYDIAKEAGLYSYKLRAAQAARDALARVMDQNLRASDGRPLAAVAGTGRLVGEDTGTPAILANPRSVRSPRISQAVLDDMAARGELAQKIADGTIVQLWKDKEGKPVYGWNPADYVLPDHPAFQRWKYIATAPDGTDVLLHADVRVHPEAADFIKRAIGADKSAVSAGKAGRAALGLSSEAKHTLLSLSPFHAVQLSLRGLMLAMHSLTGMRDFGAAMGSSFRRQLMADLGSDPLLDRGVNNTLRLLDRYEGLPEFTEGVGGRSRIINAIPGIRNLQNFIQDFTFNYLMPNLKAQMFKAEYSRYREAFPSETADHVAYRTARKINDTFGGLDWRDLGVSSTNKDILRLTTLAPDWTLSEVRSLWRLMGGFGGKEAALSGSDVTKLMAAMWMTARVLNMINSGHAHPEAPFGIVEPGKNGQADTVFSLRTLPTDLMHAVSAPRNFIMGRVNPLTIRSAIELGEGRNRYGRKVEGFQQLADLGQNVVPIPTQTLFKHMLDRTTDLSNADQVAKAAGFPVYRYRTEAEKVAQEKASENATTGPIDPYSQAKHLRNIRLEDMLRDGRITKQQLYRDLPRHEANMIVDYATLTPLQARFKRLPMKDALDVWDVAQPQEKDELHKLLWNRRHQWLRKHVHGGRVDDPSNPTWIRMRAEFPDLRGIK